MPASKQTAHLDHLTIFVGDADRSRDWYARTLGLHVEFEVASPRAVALQDSGAFGLFVEQRPSEECKPSCIVTFRVEDVDSLARTLQAGGVKFSAVPQKLFWGYGAGEACAKTIYNLSGSSARFDADSPYWIAPGAGALAGELKSHGVRG